MDRGRGEEMPILKDVGEIVIPPASAEAPPLESIIVQAADIKDKLASSGHKLMHGIGREVHVDKSQESVS